MAKLDDMMGAMGAMPDAGKEPPADAMAPKDEHGEVSDEELTYAQDLLDALKGKDAAGVAKALKRSIRACDSGSYDEPESGEEEPPASQAEGDM
jgi:hypothetical protein